MKKLFHIATLLWLASGALLRADSYDQGYEISLTTTMGDIAVPVPLSFVQSSQGLTAGGYTMRVSGGYLRVHLDPAAASDGGLLNPQLTDAAGGYGIEFPGVALILPQLTVGDTEPVFAADAQCPGGGQTWVYTYVHGPLPSNGMVGGLAQYIPGTGVRLLKQINATGTSSFNTAVTMTGTASCAGGISNATSNIPGLRGRVTYNTGGGFFHPTDGGATFFAVQAPIADVGVYSGLSVSGVTFGAGGYSPIRGTSSLNGSDLVFSLNAFDPATNSDTGAFTDTITITEFDRPGMAGILFGTLSRSSGGSANVLCIPASGNAFSCAGSLGGGFYNATFAEADLTPTDPLVVFGFPSSDSTHLHVYWTTNGAGQTGFTVEYRGPEHAGVWQSAGDTATNYLLLTGLTADTEYELRVRSYNAPNLTAADRSAWATGTGTTSSPGDQIPLPPSISAGLGADVHSSADLTFWSDNDAGVFDSFNILRSQDGVNWELVGTAAAFAGGHASDGTYTATGLASGTRYYFRVVQYQTASPFSASSPAASVTTLGYPLVGPSNLAASENGMPGADLSWNDNASDETGYLLERSDYGNMGWSEIASLGADTTNYSEAGLTPGQTYYYRVRAYRDSTYSPFTNIASVTIPGPTPTPEPTEEPTPEPTPEPTEEPTPEPTPEPTEEPENHAPVADAATLVVHQGQMLSTYLSGSDADGNHLYFQAVSSPANSAYFNLDSDGYLSFTPAAGFVGGTSFTFRVNDGLVDSPSATITINVTNTAPAATTSALSVHQGQMLSTYLSGTDADGDSLSFHTVSGPANSSYFSLDSDGYLSFTPAAGFAGDTTFVYRVYDGAAYSSNRTVTISVTNTAPAATTSALSVHQGQMLSTYLSGTDANGDSLAFHTVSGPANSSYFSLDSDGYLSFTPAAGFAGDTTFVYRVYDGAAYSSNRTVTISVTNTAPSATGATLSVHQGEMLSTYLSGTDANGDSLAFHTVSGPANSSYFSLDSDGYLSFTPAAGFAGSTSFTFRVYDGAAYSSNATITINVTNDAPTADAASHTLMQDEMFSSMVYGGDPNGDSVSYHLVSPPGFASDFSLDSGGSFTYSPSPGFAGTTSFTFRTYDGAAYSAPATVTLTVTPAEPEPTMEPPPIIME